MPTRIRPQRVLAGVALVGLVSGCAASAATPPAQPAAAATTPTPAATTPAPAPSSPAPAAPAPTRVHASAPAATAKAPVTAIDSLTAVAQRRYGIETHGGVAFGTLHRVGRDAGLLRVLKTGDLNATRTYVRQQFNAVWYHWHVSRLRIVKGSQVLVDTGVPFVVAPTAMTLHAGGKTLGRLEVSIQDEIGFVRYMHRNYPVDVVVRGQGTGHVRSSLPAATNAALPSRGSVTLSGRKYNVRSFHETALASEPVTVWILTKA
jgi:hypothetical protein